jgi:hypothetical protein
MPKYRQINWDSNDPEAHWDNPKLFFDLGLLVEETMPDINIVLELQRLNDQQYINYLTTIHTNMAKPENATIVADSPFTGAELKTLVDLFAAKVQAQANHKQAGKTITTQKRDARDEADDAVTKVAKFMESKVGLTPADAQTIGFNLKNAAARPVIAPPEGLSIRFGDAPGQVSAHWNPVSRAVTYMLFYRLANTPGAAWVLGYNNSASDAKVNGLTPGALYEFYVAAVFAGESEPGPGSLVVEHRAA